MFDKNKARLQPLLEKLGREDRIDEARELLDTVRQEHERAVSRLREILAEAA